MRKSLYEMDLEWGKAIAVKESRQQGLEQGSWIGKS